jgi:serine/threonine protein kinase
MRRRREWAAAPDIAFAPRARTMRLRRSRPPSLDTVGVLGRGSCSLVLHVTLRGRDHALKTLPADTQHHDVAAALIVREHSWLAALNHDGVIRTHGLIEYKGMPGILLDLLPGGDLTALAGAASAVWLAAVGRVCSALQVMHGQGLAHGDVKASNVLLDDQGRAVLIDLANAKPVRDCATGVLPGAWRNTARTDAAPQVTAAQSDVWHFALLLYEMMAGRAARGMAMAPDGQTMPPPLAAPGALEGDLEALAEVVDSILAAGVAPARIPGSLSKVSDVIESVIKRRTSGV